MAYRKNITPNSGRYTIRDRSEETSCDWCGCPLLIGDHAIMSPDESRVYCNDSEQRAWNAAERASRDFDPRPCCPANA